MLIDERLCAAGWHVCDRSQIDLVNHVGVAVREVPMASENRVVDYVLTGAALKADRGVRPTLHPARQR